MVLDDGTEDITFAVENANKKQKILKDETQALSFAGNSNDQMVCSKIFS